MDRKKWAGRDGTTSDCRQPVPNAMQNSSYAASCACNLLRHLLAIAAKRVWISPVLPFLTTLIVLLLGHPFPASATFSQSNQLKKHSIGNAVNPLTGWPKARIPFEDDPLLVADRDMAVALNNARMDLQVKWRGKGMARNRPAVAPICP